jgi:hypothetical protein
MGIFNDDQLAGQYKLRMDLSWDLEPPLARSLARSPKCRPVHHSFSATACVRSGRSPARSYQRKPCLQPSPTFLSFFFEGFFFGTSGASKRDSMSANPQRESQGLGAHFALRSKLRMPGRKILEHGLTDIEVRILIARVK